MPSYQLTTARSAFTETKADKRYRCAGCGVPIEKGAPMLEKPFYGRGSGGKATGKTRLHYTDSCWENYDEAAVQTLITRRDLFIDGRESVKKKRDLLQQGEQFKVCAICRKPYELQCLECPFCHAVAHELVPPDASELRVKVKQTRRGRRREP